MALLDVSKPERSPESDSSRQPVLWVRGVALWRAFVVTKANGWCSVSAWIPGASGNLFRHGLRNYRLLSLGLPPFELFFHRSYRLGTELLGEALHTSFRVD